MRNIEEERCWSPSKVMELVSGGRTQVTTMRDYHVYYETQVIIAFLSDS